MGRAYARIIKADEVSRAVGHVATEASDIMAGSIVESDRSVLGPYESLRQVKAFAEAV